MNFSYSFWKLSFKVGDRKIQNLLSADLIIRIHINIIVRFSKNRYLMALCDKNLNQIRFILEVHPVIDERFFNQTQILMIKIY